jgi:uncharacterized protein YndB with AHSA1/START domain
MKTNDSTKNIVNSGKQELLITREFNAPCEIVWNALKDPSIMRNWWGPKNFTSPAINIDFRVGGKYLSCMRSPDGMDSWSTGVYKEIIPLKKILATNSFADEKGNVVPASYYGMKGDFPLEVHVLFTFEESRPGKTKMVLHHIGLPQSEMIEMMRQGWNESFDKLVDLLKQKAGK